MLRLWSSSISYNTYSKIFYIRRIRFSSIPASNKITEVSSEKQINDLESMFTVLPKERVKLAQREPFVKNMFAGNFDTELLTYPQLQNQDVVDLENVINILQKVSEKQKKPKDIREAIQNLRQQRCLGLQCSLKEGGRELNQTEQCRFNEVLLEGSFKFSLMNNELSILSLSRFGSDEQKTNYLTRLLDGKILAVICLGDHLSGTENSKTVATLSDDFKTYMLNGKKSCVVAGSEADLYLVFSHMADSVKGSLHELDLTVFLVDSNSPGITVEKIDCKDPNLNGMSNIIFNNTPVTAENILGNERDGRKLLASVIQEHYINFGVVNLNILKKLIKHLSNEVFNNSTPKAELYKTEAVTSKLGSILINAYMVESMLYFTTGLMSTYEQQDCELETLITKVFSTELSLKATEIGFSVSGPTSLESKHYCQKLQEEVISLNVLNEPEYIMRILIALLGLQYSGKKLVDTVKKLRNPLFNGTFVMKRLWQDRRQHDGNPKLTIGLKNYLHLSCQEGADLIEFCVLRLQFVTESLFAKYGIDILNRHGHLRRLADIVMHIYAMTACLSRASRSYCIGLQNAEAEIMIANLVCKYSSDIVKKNISDIIYDYESVDRRFQDLCEKVFKEKKYYFAHPLNRNF
ncbi:hypothetical protein WA026_023148 [Henosepilachna vigintioctopunctata]|uniref:Acyl-CoA dehydrogenase family member 9, mitochondrial n=1 Tax=Henosepilachna vigintioctopunctata TaxID=420089 RepID=A0AAW1TZE5_9CUCU